MSQHISFPSIGQFVNTKHSITRRAQFVGKDDNGDPIYNNTARLPTIKYRGTVKLHGTNAAIVFPFRGAVYAQSRENVITPEKDNAGFARFVSELSPSELDIITRNFRDNVEWDETRNQAVVVFGEWAGKGIQSNVAISELPKAFYIFGACLVDLDEEYTSDELMFIKYGKWKLEGLENKVRDILSYPSFVIEIDFEHPEVSLDQINKWVLEVEEECPVAAAHGVKGIGEGIVWIPRDLAYDSPRFWFKAKGAAHSKSKVAKLAVVDVEKAKSIQEFIDKVLDEGRLEQGFQWLATQGKSQDATSTGHFMKWVLGDIIKENQLDLEANNIKEAELGKIVQLPARRWYLERINK